MASVARAVFLKGARATSGLLTEFASVLSGVYVNGRADLPGSTWAQTVFGVSLALAQAGTASTGDWMTNALGWLVHTIMTNIRRFEEEFTAIVSFLATHPLTQILTDSELRAALATALGGAIMAGAATLATAAGAVAAAIV